MPRVNPPEPGRSVIQPTFLSCHLEQTGPGAAWLKVGGELDLATAWYLADQLDLLFAEARLVVVDLSELTFMDGAGLSAVVGADSRARARACRLVIVRVPHQVEGLLRLTGVVDRLQLSPSELILAL